MVFSLMSPKVPTTVKRHGNANVPSTVGSVLCNGVAETFSCPSCATTMEPMYPVSKASEIMPNVPSGVSYSIGIVWLPLTDSAVYL